MKSKKENIAEYILYIWQMEDYLRAFPAQAESNEEMQQVAEMMHHEGVMEKGHVNIANVALSQLEDLHKQTYDAEATYRAAWLQLMPAMTVFKAKTERPTQSDMEACLCFLYHIMLLRLQKKEISKETLATLQQVSKLLSYLSTQFSQLDA